MFTLNNIDNNRRRQWWQTLMQSKRLVFVEVNFPGSEPEVQQKLNNSPPLITFVALSKVKTFFWIQRLFRNPDLISACTVLWIS